MNKPFSKKALPKTKEQVSHKQHWDMFRQKKDRVVIKKNKH